MGNSPKVIYLHDPHGYFETDDYAKDNTVTWSEEQIDKNDQKYIRSDVLMQIVNNKEEDHICKCGTVMMKVTNDTYYCQECGRLLDADTLMFPGDAWFEPKNLKVKE